MAWPAHLLKTKRLLVEGLKLMGFHGRLRLEPKPDGSFTIVVEIPAPGAPDITTSARAMKRDAAKR